MYTHCRNFLALAVFTALSLAPAAHAITIMPLGDSITDGVDFTGNSQGGYRDPLYTLLQADGIPFTYVGVADDNSTMEQRVSGQTHHDGYGGYNIQDIIANLDGVADPAGGGASNLGGYWLDGKHGTGRGSVYPDYVLLHIGTNTLLQQGYSTITTDITTLVEKIHHFSPHSRILVAEIIPIADDPGFLTQIQGYNYFIAHTLVPEHWYCSDVNQYKGFMNADGTVDTTLLGNDHIHPVLAGYDVMAGAWEVEIKRLIDAGY